jgi:hypothetical protein
LFTFPESGNTAFIEDNIGEEKTPKAELLVNTMLSFRKKLFTE